MEDLEQLLCQHWTTSPDVLASAKRGISTIRSPFETELLLRRQLIRARRQ